MAEIYDCNSMSDVSSMPQTRSYAGQGAWVTEVDGGLAILSGDGGTKVSFWTGGSSFTDVDLGGMVTPVGATLLDGKLYVACFGSWPDPSSDSGLAVIDVASRKLDGTFPFSDSRLHIHNAYAFEILGKKEIFVAVLGNPWTGPVAGRGLVRFDRSSGSFDLDTTDDALNVRSAKQQDDGAIFVVTQEADGGQTQLARLVPNGQQLTVVAKAQLPALPKGNGGADVILGRESDTVWVTDRQDGLAGKLYHYRYSANALSMTNVRDTGIVPRYTVILDNGDIVSCNQNGGDLSVFNGLADAPLDASIVARRVATVNGPMFFVQTDKVSQMWAMV